MSSSPAAASRQASKYSSAESAPEAISAVASATDSSSSSHAHLGLRRGDAEGAVGGIGRLLEDDLPRPARPRHVGAQHVLELDHVGGRLDLVEVELGDPVDVLEDSGELARHPLDLLLGEAQAGEPGDVQHLLAVDHGGF